MGFPETFFDRNSFREGKGGLQVEKKEGNRSGTREERMRDGWERQVGASDSNRREGGDTEKYRG